MTPHPRRASRLSALLLALALCCIAGSRAVAAEDCQPSPEQAVRAGNALSMQPSYYDMRSLRAIVFTSRVHHCYMLLEAFAGQVEFRVGPRRAIGGQRPANIALRLFFSREGRLMPVPDLPPQPDGVFRASLPGGSIVADFYLKGNGAPATTEIFILDRRVLSNAQSLQLTSGDPLVVAAPAQKAEPSEAIRSGPLVQFTLSRDARIAISFSSTDDTALCLAPPSLANPTENLNLANDALNPLLIVESDGDASKKDSNDRDSVIVNYDADHKQGRLSASLHPGTYFLQLGPMLACDQAPAALSVAMATTFPGFDPLVTALEGWIAGTPLGSRIEAVAIDHDVSDEDIQPSFGGEPPPGLHPTTRLSLRANFYCDEPIGSFDPIAEHAGRLTALLTNGKPSDVLVIVEGGRKHIRMAFDPATNAAWSDPYKGGCAGAGEALISTPVVEMFEAVATINRMPAGFPQMVRQFVESGFPAPARANFDISPESTDGASVRLDCLKGAVDQGTRNILGGRVRYWQRLDVDFNLVGSTGTRRVRVVVHGAYTEGGGEGSAHCPADGQFTAVLDGKYDTALNGFALQLAQQFARFADAKRSGL